MIIKTTCSGSLECPLYTDLTVVETYSPQKYPLSYWPLYQQNISKLDYFKKPNIYDGKLILLSTIWAHSSEPTMTIFLYEGFASMSNFSAIYHGINKQWQRKAWHIASPTNLTRWPWPLTLKINRVPDSLKD